MQPDESARLVVTALLVVRQQRITPDTSASELLDATCDALGVQTRLPDRLVVVDATADRMMRSYLQDHDRLKSSYPELSVVVVPAGTAFAAIIDTAVDALPEPGEDLVVARRPGARAGRRPVRPRDRFRWLWLLHEDSVPDASALAELTSAVVQSERVGVAGCKVLDAADRRVLLDIGTEVTRTGRHVDGLAVRPGGQADQGQHDDRRDVLSVSSAGMLVRQDTYNNLGGFDPAFDGEGDGLDLGWRAHLIGHSVIVVPAARVCQVPTPGAVRADTLRRHRQVALARASLLGLPFLALWTMLSSLLLAIMLVLLKRPRAGWVEFVQATAPFGVVRILGARGRFFRRAVIRRRHLGGLFVPTGGAVHAVYDGLRDTVSTRSGGLVGGGVTPASGETSPVHADAEDLRTPRGSLVRTVFGPAGLVVLLLAVASAVLWRGLLTDPALTGTGRGLSGGQLLGFDTDATGIWRTYRDAWIGPGLGHPGTPAPYLAVLAPLAWLVGLLPWVDHGATGAVTVAWLLVAAMPLSGLVAYRAGRVVTTARWPRVAMALLWGTLPPLTTAIAQGRLGPVVGHILLPFALAGVLATARRGAGWALAFGTALVVALTGAFSPVLLLACGLVALAAIVVAPGTGRLRELAVLVVPWLLLAPWTREVLTGDHRLVLAGPGALATRQGTPPLPWQLALVHPGGPGSYAVLAAAPVVAIGVFGLVRSGLGRAGAAVIGVGLLGLAAGLAASHVVLAQPVQGDATPWSGSALDVYAFGLLGAGLLGIGAPCTVRWRPFAYTVTALSCVGACAVGGFAVWAATPRLLSPTPRVLPALVQRQLTSSRAPRTLLLTAMPGGGLTYRLIGREAGLPARDLHSPYPAYDASIASVVTALTSTDSTPDDARRLHQLAIGYVVVRGAAAVLRLNPSLGAAGGLTRLSRSRSTALWRVDPVSTAGSTVTSSRLVIARAGRPETAVASQAQHGRADVRLPAGSIGRSLVVAEGSGWADRARVTLGGVLLPPSVSDGQPTYALPAAGGRLQVQPGVVNHRLPWLQLGLLLLVLYLAVPFGARRPRHDQPQHEQAQRS